MLVWLPGQMHGAAGHNYIGHDYIGHDYTSHKYYAFPGQMHGVATTRVPRRRLWCSHCRATLSTESQPRTRVRLRDFAARAPRRAKTGVAATGI